MRTTDPGLSPPRPALLASLVAIGVTACAFAPPAPHADPPAGLTAGPLAADSADSRELAPGVTHTTLHFGEGPWRVHLVEVAADACGVEFRAVKGDDHAVGRERVSSMARRIAEANQRPVLAGVNADFFSFTPPGVPDGPHITAGHVVAWSEHIRPAFGVMVDGRRLLAEVALEGGLRSPEGFVAPVARVNPGAPGDGLSLFTGTFSRSPDNLAGTSLGTDSADVVVEVREVGPPALVGDTARGIVVAIGPADQPRVDVGAGGARFVGRGSAATFLRTFVATGDTLRWLLGAIGGNGAEPAPLELVGGGPMLLRAGEPVYATDPRRSADFATTRHPRTAVALRPDGSVLFLTVDGRAPGYSIGMSLDELAHLLRALGATEGLNLDGGGSTTLVLGDSVANRPSDEAGERAVANALLLVGPHPGTCGLE